MARTWLSIRVDLVDGAHAPEVWPRPGRVLLARPGMTFRMFADAINDAFARWDRAHLHAFTMADGSRIALRGPWDDLDEDDLADTEVTLSRLTLGEQFAFEFDFGDGWMHLCTVADEKVDPREVYGEVPDRPVPYAGWGWIPDQYGRRWDTDDGDSSPPPQPEPPLGDLPDLHYTWGSRAFSVSTDDAADVSPQDPWTGESITALRQALAAQDVPAAVDMLAGRDAVAVAHLAGPMLLDAIEAGHDRAGLVIERLVGPLSERGWLGDDELVDQFDRVTQGLGDGLQPVPVRLEELAHMLDGPTDLDEGWMLELATGRFWPRDPEGIAGEQRPEDFDPPDAFLAVFAVGSGPGYGDMRDFIDTAVTDDALATRLSDAIRGTGAFRRFRTVLFDDEHWWERWSTWSHERQLARARWWLADAGYRPATRTERAGDGA